MTKEEEIIYNHVRRIEIDRKGRPPAPMDLSAIYAESESEKYFRDAVPCLSDDFICVFQKLPFDASGICFLADKASKLGIRKGIRINEKFKEFPPEAKVALLHEMVHALGATGHDSDFILQIVKLRNTTLPC